jgi:hypothetical protein
MSSPPLHLVRLYLEDLEGREDRFFVLVPPVGRRGVGRDRDLDD